MKKQMNDSEKVKIFEGMVFDALKIIDNATQEIDERKKRANINEDLMIVFLKQCLSNVDVNKENAILLTARVLLTALHRYGATQQSNIKSHKRHNARKGGRAKAAGNNPKQQAKSDIKKKWETWHNDPKNVDIKDAIFIKDMERHYCDDKDPNALQSRAVIERWVRKWKKEQNNTHPA